MEETKILSKDYATSSGQTGVIKSVGQIVDFSKVIQEGATIKSITIYCPTGTRVTQSKYTTINNYLVTDLDTGDQEQHRPYFHSEVRSLMLRRQE